MRTRILVLDDQEYLREIMAMILAEAGFPALAVDTPVRALQLLEELRPDLLVLDMSLPGIDGLQFLDLLRADPQWQTLPVLIVSGDPTKLLKVEGRPYVVPLSKPFDATVLVAEVTRFLAPTTLPQSA
jgi:CheY-like chemotaxis protein